MVPHGPGSSISTLTGHLYEQNGRDFIMRANDSKLIVSHAVDLPERAKGAQ